MKKYIILLIFSYVYGNAQQAKIDSLKKQINITVDKHNKLIILSQVCTELSKYGDDKNEELKYYKMALNLATEQDNFTEQINISYIISQYYLTVENFKSAEYYGKLAQKISYEHNCLQDEIRTYALLGRIYNHFDKYKKAISYYHKGIDKYKALTDDDKKQLLQTLSTIYANLSVVYKNIHKDSLADYYVLLSSKIADKTKDYMRKSNLYATIAWTYEDMNNYDMAIKYFKLALKDSAKIKLKIYNIASHHGLGYVYGENGQYKLALHHDSIALAYFIRTKNNIFIQAVLGNMSDVFLKQNRMQLAMSYAQKALNISKKIKVKKTIIDNWILLSKIYFKDNNIKKSQKILLRLLNDTTYSKYLMLRHKPVIYKILSDVEQQQQHWKKAFHYRKLYDKYNQLEIQKKLKHISGIETKYQTEKKEKENLKLKAEKAEQAIVLEKENKIISIIAGGLIFSLITLIIFGFYYQRNKKQKELIENLQKELHHRVKNNLTIIDSLIEDIKDDFNAPEITSRLNDLQNRIESINQVHRQLYMDNKLTQLNFKKYVDKLFASIQESFDNKNIKIDNQINENTGIPVEKSFPVGLIVNEFITNSFKYAFDKDSQGLISIKFTETAKSYVLSLADNGKGFPNNFNINKLGSFGINIMKLLSRQLGGTFLIKSNNGVQVEIEFPKQ